MGPLGPPRLSSRQGEAGRQQVGVPGTPGGVHMDPRRGARSWACGALHPPPGHSGTRVWRLQRPLLPSQASGALKTAVLLLHRESLPGTNGPLCSGPTVNGVGTGGSGFLGALLGVSSFRARGGGTAERSG